MAFVSALRTNQCVLDIISNALRKGLGARLRNLGPDYAMCCMLLNCLRWNLELHSMGGYFGTAANFLNLALHENMSP